MHSADFWHVRDIGEAYSTKKVSMHGYLNTDVPGLLKTLFTKPSACLLSVYHSYSFAVLYASFEVFPEIFTKVYNLGHGGQELAYLSMVIWVAIAFSLYLIIEQTLIKPHAKRWRDAKMVEAEVCVGVADSTLTQHQSTVQRFVRHYSRVQTQI